MDPNTRTHLLNIYNRLDNLYEHIDNLNSQNIRHNLRNNYYNPYSQRHYTDDSFLYNYGYPYRSNTSIDDDFNSFFDRVYNSRQTRNNPFTSSRNTNLFNTPNSNIDTNTRSNLNTSNNTNTRSNTSNTSNTSNLNTSSNTRTSEILTNNLRNTLRNLNNTTPQTSNIEPQRNTALEHINDRIRSILSTVTSRTLPVEVSILTTNPTFDEELVIISHKSVTNNTEIDTYKNLKENMDENMDEDRDNQTDESNDICVICREPFEDDSICRRVNKCKHIFHVNCIDKWFESNITCPHCRQDIREDQSTTNDNNEQNNSNTNLFGLNEV